MKIALLVAVLAALGYGGWRYMQRAEAPPTAQQPAPEAPADAPAPAPEASAPVAEEDHPLEAEADEKGNPPLAADASTALEDAVRDWLGKENVLKFVAIDGLANRVVATIDNLPRSHAASRLWPLYPVGGRMAVQQANEGLQIAPDNAARYNGVVGFVTSIDAAKAAAVYRRVYPVLQHSYEELGYPGKQFNNRLVAVIDHLIATPDLEGPLALKLVQVQGEVPSQQPWLRYEYADPKLEALSSGQKILLRMGPENSRRIKASLQTLRSQIVAKR